MKKIISVFFACLLFCSFLIPIRAVYASSEPARMINVVYDDSGSMYHSGGLVDTWCQAKYSMEVFAAMLGENDTLNVYYMSDYQTGTGSAPRIVLHGKDGAATNVGKLHDEKTRAGNTPFNSVRKAYSDLSKATADEKWLVILTDGAFEDGALSKNEIDSFLAAKDSNINVMFLAMGPSAAGITSKENQNIFYVEAKTNNQILNQITGICTRIFNSNKLDVNASSKKFSFDVPMGELTVFAQGANVQINGIKKDDGALIKSARTPVEVKYSECDATNYNNEPARDLVGSIATFVDDFSMGDYTVDVTGAETIEIYYKPNVEVAAYLTDSHGKEVTDMANLEAGEYTISFGFVKAGTKEKVSQSKLLGDVTYEAYVTNNGAKHDKMYSNGDKITLEEGTLSIDASARYLDYHSVSTHLDYSIFKDKTLSFSIKNNPTYSITSKGIENKDFIELEAKIDGREITPEEWAIMDLPTITLENASRDFKIDEPVIEKTDQPGIYRIHPELPGNKPSTGTYVDCNYNVAYQQKFGAETWAGDTSGTIKLNDTRSWWERNWDLFVKLIILAIILFILAGYLPFIKHYLPKSLKKNPTINCTPEELGMEERTRNGVVQKGFLSTIIPYIPQTATIEFVPSSVSGIPQMNVRAIKRRRMLVTNIKDYADKDNITFNGSVIAPDIKKFETSAALVTSVVKNGWVYDCTFNG